VRVSAIVSHPRIGLVASWSGSVVLKECATDIKGEVFGGQSSGDGVGISLARLSDRSLAGITLRDLFGAQAGGEDLMEGN
jgi:hypothetical protein